MKKFGEALVQKFNNTVINTTINQKRHMSTTSGKLLPKNYVADSYQTAYDYTMVKKQCTTHATHYLTGADANKYIEKYIQICEEYNLHCPLIIYKGIDFTKLKDMGLLVANETHKPFFSEKTLINYPAGFDGLKPRFICFLRHPKIINMNVFQLPLKNLPEEEEKYLIQGFDFFTRMEALTKKPILEPIDDYTF